MEEQATRATERGRRIAVLGSTGSIGRQALDVIAARKELEVVALGAGANWQGLAEQARWFRPGLVALADETAARQVKVVLPPETRLLSGPDAMTDLVRAIRPDVLLTGLVGAAGLAPTLAAIECGSTLALANKETLVMAGQIVMPAARAGGVDILPVDSEHSGILQCLASGRTEEVSRVTLTASGGALRDWPAERVARATVSDALNHPTWAMGPKITIDSATLVNKALEIVEAHWLFGLPAERIDVLIHPESIVHAMVEYRDGSVLAQLGLPDMTTPIAYALSHPRRWERDVRAPDLAEMGRLTFRRPEGRFARAVALGHEAIRRGGAAGAVLNAANEAAVAAFLEGRLPFGRIVPMIEETLNRAEPIREVTIDALLAADAWARRSVAEKLLAGAEPPNDPAGVK